MGQKLVTIKFSVGSSSDLWDPNLSPDFEIEISGSSGWQSQSSYYPNLNKVNDPPVNLGDLQPLTNTMLQGLIKNNQSAAFLVDDSVTRWRINFREKFLTEGNWELLAEGTF